MTKTWERDLAVERMREDPTVSYRALAKVLGISDSTIRQWRDEEGIPPRPHHNTGQRRNGTRSAPRPGKPAWSIPIPTHDQDDGYENDEDQQDEEKGYEHDDAPSVRSEVLAPGFGPAWESMNGLFGWKGPKPSRSTRAPAPSPKRSTPTVSGARLRAITAELDARKPRGPHAVELLVEAAPYLAGRVTALAQYGEARGCAREDIAAAERIVAGKEKGTR